MIYIKINQLLNNYNQNIRSSIAARHDESPEEDYSDDSLCSTTILNSTTFFLDNSFILRKF